ncbi:MAG: transglycosylase domain-containing protein [Clostridia bacterium]|nr:transglycosylase domain-containing protein [Clostridia bacterium]
MEKIFKKFCLVLSFLLVVSSVSLCFTSPRSINLNKFDFDMFECKSVVNSVKNLDLKQTSIIYVKNKSGNWVEYQRLHGDENRILVDKDKFSKNLKNAFIAIEDERFLEHDGVDWKRTFFAMGNLVFKYYSSNQGGSTITQQLIKNITDDRDNSGMRKIREIVRALYLETKMEKDDILAAYLNTIALANGLCGVQAAANYYFNKDVSELSLVECASIAAITKHPVKYDPKNNPKDNKKRRNTVIAKMYELEMISKEEYDAAYDSDITLNLGLNKSYDTDVNNYFVDALIEDSIKALAKQYNCTESIASTMLYSSGYKIYATVDTDIQKSMEKVFENREKYFTRVSKSGQKIQSAMTIMDYSGHIVGVVGGVGKKTESRSLNRATQTPQQPGSTMKPIGVYALALEKNKINYSTVIEDSPVKNYDGPGKSGPRNANGKYNGDVTVQYALETSLNTIPVKVLNQIGFENSYKFLTEKLHAKSLNEIDINASSLALGGCQHGITTTESAAAYAIFGNQGKYYEPTTFYKIEDAEGNVIVEYKNEGEQVISADTATVMNRLLQNVVYGAHGTGTRVRNTYAGGSRIFGKTGTTSDYYDLWFVGGSPYYVGSIWYGYDENETLSSKDGTVRDVWEIVMKDIHSDLKYKNFTFSKSVFTAQYCSVTGKKAGETCKAITGYYKKGTSLERCDGVHEKEDEDTSSAASSSSQTSTSSQESSSTNSSDVQGSQESSSSDSSNESSSTESNSSSENTSTNPNSSDISNTTP